MGFFKKNNKVAPAPSTQGFHPAQYGEKSYIVCHAVTKQN